jgi:hypothetical protein
MHRIHCDAFPNPIDREVLVRNPLIIEPVCSYFSPVSSEEHKTRQLFLEKLGLKT